MVINIYNPSLRLLCKFAFNRLPAKVATLCLYGQNRLYNIFYSHLSIAHSLAETFRHLFSIIANFFFPALAKHFEQPNRISSTSSCICIFSQYTQTRYCCIYIYGICKYYLCRIHNTEQQEFLFLLSQMVLLLFV